MTITAQISSQSIGTSTNKGDNLFPQKLTLATGTTAYRIEARITNGANTYSQQPVSIFHVCSSFDLTAAAAMASLHPAAVEFEVSPGPKASQVQIRQSVLEPAAGAYVYLWFSVPATTTAATLAVNIIELP